MKNPDGTLRARVQLAIDPRNSSLTAEELFGEIELLDVEIICWVTVYNTDPDRIRPGAWHDASSGFVITNDPSKNDDRRVRLHVTSSSLSEARETLFDALSGKKQPNEVWKN